MQKQLLIVGIDPGTTTGIAILDTSRMVLATSSIRGLDFGTLIKEIIPYGNVLAVGTDKKVVPHLIARFAAKTGSKIFSPKDDLTKSEKQELIKEYPAKGHEADALAAALFAYYELKPILDKIGIFLEKERKNYLFADVTKLVVLKGIAIKNAIDLIEQPKSEVERIVRKSKEGHSEEKEIKPLRPFILEHKKTEGKELKEKIKELNQFLANLGNRIVIKKLNNLSYDEILKKSYLNIKEGDILLVSDASISDKDAINFLKDKVSIIVCRKKINSELPFVTIDSKKLNIIEIDDFAAIDQKELEKVRESSSVLMKIIAEYKKKRLK